MDFEHYKFEGKDQSVTWPLTNQNAAYKDRHLGSFEKWIFIFIYDIHWYYLEQWAIVYVLVWL